MPAIFEFKVEVMPGVVAALEALLAESEEQRLLVLEDKPSGRAWLTGYHDSISEAQATWRDFSQRVPRDWLVADPTSSELADKDWKESYKEHFKAWKFGRLNWVPIWERKDYALPAGEEVLWLDPGMAFGTGNHETTRLCCERLVRFAETRGCAGSIIDAGCGSGILALSAAKLGFERTSAFDNDALSVDVSRENAALNGLAGRVDFYVGDLVTGLAGRSADLVLANIQADVLMRFAVELTTAVAPGGTLALSGILASEADLVRRAFAARVPAWQGEVRVMGEWSDLALSRPAGKRSRRGLSRGSGCRPG